MKKLTVSFVLVLLIMATLGLPGWMSYTGDAMVSPPPGPMTVADFRGNALWIFSPTQDWFVRASWVVQGGDGTESWQVKTGGSLACAVAGLPGDNVFSCDHLAPLAGWQVYELWDADTWVASVDVYVPPYRASHVENLVLSHDHDGLHIGWDITENKSAGQTWLTLRSVSGVVCADATDPPCNCKHSPSGAGLLGSYKCDIEDWDLFRMPPYLACLVDVWETDTQATWYLNSEITGCSHKALLPITMRNH